ncbi:MAG: hypothetical protein FWH20_00275 [Oscillospiraceae bacterium]|nr:hypothetical protein [Oscillospiraceae bacterium]
MSKIRKIRLKTGGEKISVEISGQQAKTALEKLHTRLFQAGETHELGLDVIDMFMEIFGEEITEKLLLDCKNNPEKTMKIIRHIITRKLLPMAVKQRKYEDKRGVKKYV